MTGFSAKINTSALQKDLKALTKDTDAATKKGLRAVAARVRTEGRKGAPVYSGPRTTVSVGKGKQIPLVPGELRKSIAASKRFESLGNGEYRLTVGPRGGHVHLYMLKEERRAGFMAHARETIAGGEAKRIHEAAWARAINKSRGVK